MTLEQYLLAFAGMGVQLFLLYLVLFLVAGRRKTPRAHM